MTSSALAAAKERRKETRAAIKEVRKVTETRRVPFILDMNVGARAVAVAARILEDRCKLTGEDPAAVLDDLERSV